MTGSLDFGSRFSSSIETNRSIGLNLSTLFAARWCVSMWSRLFLDIYYEDIIAAQTEANDRCCKASYRSLNLYAGSKDTMIAIKSYTATPSPRDRVFYSLSGSPSASSPKSYKSPSFVCRPILQMTLDLTIFTGPQNQAYRQSPQPPTKQGVAWMNALTPQ